MKPSHPSDPAPNAAVRDWTYDIWGQEECKVARADLILATPCCAVGNLSEHEPLVAYRRMLPLAETRALYPCSVLQTGARSLQQHHCFEE